MERVPIGHLRIASMTRQMVLTSFIYNLRLPFRPIAPGSLREFSATDGSFFLITLCCLYFCGKLGYAENGLTVPFPLYFFEVSEQGKFFGWQTVRLVFERLCRLRSKKISNRDRQSLGNKLNILHI